METAVKIELTEEEKRLVREGQPIEAIRDVRSRHGSSASFQEAKEAVYDYLATFRSERDEEMARKMEEELKTTPLHPDMVFKELMMLSRAERRIVLDKVKASDANEDAIRFGLFSTGERFRLSQDVKKGGLVRVRVGTIGRILKKLDKFMSVEFEGVADSDKRWKITVCHMERLNP